MQTCCIFFTEHNFDAELFASFSSKTLFNLKFQIRKISIRKFPNCITLILLSMSDLIHVQVSCIHIIENYFKQLLNKLNHISTPILKPNQFHLATNFSSTDNLDDSISCLLTIPQLLIIIFILKLSLGD